jgi:hypothetical protein
MDEVLKEIFKQGLVGAVAVGALWFAWKKDRETATLYERMFASQNEMHENYRTLLAEFERTVETAVDAIRNQTGFRTR